MLTSLLDTDWLVMALSGRVHQYSLILAAWNMATLLAVARLTTTLLTLLGKLGIVTECLTLTGRNLGICQADAVIGQHGTEARHALFQCLTGFGYACHKDT